MRRRVESYEMGDRELSKESFTLESSHSPLRPERPLDEQTRGLQRVVNPEQASKVLMRPPTRHLRGEGRSVSGKQPTSAPETGTGVVGAAREEGSLGNVGGPIGCGVAPATSPWVAA